VVAAINDELTEMTVAYGSKLRRQAGLRRRTTLSAVRRSPAAVTRSARDRCRRPPLGEAMVEQRRHVPPRRRRSPQALAGQARARSAARASSPPATSLPSSRSCPRPTAPSRATKTGQYAQREDVPLETQDGRMLTGREAVADEIKAWSVNFSKRAESQDVGAVRLALRGVKDSDEGRETFEKAIAAGFAGHRYAYRLEATASAELEARLVIALAGPPMERFRVREERVGDQEHGFNRMRFDMASERKIRDRIHAATGLETQSIGVSPGMTNHGRNGVTYRLNRLIEHGAALDKKGKAITNVADTRIAAREWGPSLRSQSVRDTMHLMLSAKAASDVEALRRAARSFCTTASSTTSSCSGSMSTRRRPATSTPSSPRKASPARNCIPPRRRSASGV
jgi:hypothetical protein